MNPSASSTSPPPLSLLSLSDAAASARHIPVRPPPVPAAAPIPIKQRHRSSFSQSRKRRPSDARDLLLNHTVSPPVVPLLGRASEDRDRATSSRLQALSLSPPGVSQALLSKSMPLDGMAKEDAAQTNARKKGTVFRCESCSKVYRHPSCLVKHRWEHSPHWREASKFLLSKHQQVQLLEAAAILSHLSPTESGGGTSLPEDRSLWPSYLSGGLLPLPNGSLPNGVGSRMAMRTTADAADMSMSEDEQERPALTQFRPGLLGHPNPSPAPTPTSRSAPVPVPGWEDNALSVSGGGSGSWAHTPHTSTSGPFSLSTSGPFSLSLSYSSSERGWSLPRSSVRGGESDREDDDADADANEREGQDERKNDAKLEEQEWDGMDMEMDL